MARDISDEMLDGMIEARRAMKMPAGPSEDLIACTVARLGAGAAGFTQVSHKRGWWTVKKVRFTAGLAAAAGLILVAGVLFGVLGRGRVAFADVIESVKGTTCVHFKMAGKLPQANGVAGDVKAEVWITQGGCIRQEMETAFGKFVVIQDPKVRKQLMLVPAARQATLMEMANAPAAAQGPGQENFLEKFKALKAREAVSVGAKEIAGHEAEGFKVSGQMVDTTVWVDVGTKMPVEVEQTIKSSHLPETTLTMTDFVWNVDVDPALMSLTPPAGYATEGLDSTGDEAESGGG